MKKSPAPKAAIARKRAMRNLKRKMKGGRVDLEREPSRRSHGIWSKSKNISGIS